MTKTKIITSLMFLSIMGTSVLAETYYDAYKNIFGGELAKKYPNAATSKTECEKMMREYVKNYGTLNRECYTVTVDGKQKQICSGTDLNQLGGVDILIEEYCTPKKVTKYVGYHDSDDKSNFWIPKDIEPLMMTNSQLEEYRIINLQTNKYYDLSSPFAQRQIQKANAENRPVIIKDMTQAQNDWISKEKIRKALLSGGMVSGYDPAHGYGTRFQPLSDKQEQELKRLYDEYGDGIFVGDDKFKKNLELYRERQEYMKKNAAKNLLQNTLKSLF